jgi:hypothetical protein
MASDTPAATPDDPRPWEARTAMRAGIATIAAGFLTILGALVSGIANSGRPRPGDNVLTILDTLRLAAEGRPIPPGNLAAITEYVGTHTVPFILGAVLMGLGSLLAFVPLAYLYRATRARVPRAPRIAIITAAIGAVGFGIGQIVTFTAYYLGARDFANGSDRSNSAAADALSNSGVAAGQPIAQVGQLALALAFALISLHAMRAGLLTRFTGFLGMIVGATLILPLDQFGIIRSFWLISVGVLILGRSPKGRPAAWDAREAVPWPSQQKIREERDAARREAGGEPAGGRRGARGAAKREAAEETRRASRVPAAPAPQPRRKDRAADGDGDDAADGRRKRKRRS